MSHAPSLVIRRAMLDDAARLAELGARTFYDTFAQFNTPEDMDAYLSQSFHQAQQATEIADPQRITLLAEIDGEMVGYAQLHTGQALECVTGPNPLELLRLYVDQGWHGVGVAAALMDAYVDEARQGGYQTLWLCVWEHNHRAKAFYERKWGFRDVGSKIFMLGSDAQIDRVLTRPL